MLVGGKDQKKIQKEVEADVLCASTTFEEHGHWLEENGKLGNRKLKTNGHYDHQDDHDESVVVRFDVVAGHIWHSDDGNRRHLKRLTASGNLSLFIREAGNRVFA